jgi:hypothetical protein
MSRNGSGVYTLVAGNPVVTGTTITSSWANTTMQNIADGLTQSVASDGQTPMSGALNMATNKINNLGTPTVSTDASTKAYVDLTQTASGITGGTITGATLTNDTIDSTPIGSTTRSTVKATTLDLGLSTQSVAIGQGNASIMKNRIINGAINISQYNGTSSVTVGAVNPAYYIDRWAVTASVASKLSIQQLSSSPPVGFSNYIGFTSLSAYSIGSSDYFSLQQRIEGFNFADLQWGTANAKTITLSFWVQSSLTGTFGGSLVNSAGNRFYPFTYTISVANTWQQISVTIAGDTSGTWVGATNGIGLTVSWGLGIGSGLSTTAGAWTASTGYGATGATSVVGTSGATFYITGVQLEVGSSATGFEYRQYGQELALCQRYFEMTYFQGTSTGTNTGFGTIAFTVNSDGGNNANITYYYKVTKRGSTTITFYTQTGTSGSWDYARSGASGTMTMNVNTISDSVATCYGNIGAAWTAGYIKGHLTVSSEL